MGEGDKNDEHTAGESEEAVLKGNLILADPSLQEPTFFQSVLLVTEHSSKDGAHGYILNRPLERSVGELVSNDIIPEAQRERLKDVPVFFGGPVNQDHLTFASLGWSEAEDELQYSTHLSAGEASMHEMEGYQIRAFVGYSGWSQGQLEGEMEGRSWLKHRPEREIIEMGKIDDLWKDLLRDMSPWHKVIADEPDDLGLN